MGEQYWAGVSFQQHRLGKKARAQQFSQAFTHQKIAITAAKPQRDPAGHMLQGGDGGPQPGFGIPQRDIVANPGIEDVACQY